MSALRTGRLDTIPNSSVARICPTATRVQDLFTWAFIGRKYAMSKGCAMLVQPREMKQNVMSRSSASLASFSSAARCCGAQSVRTVSSSQAQLQAGLRARNAEVLS
eukprot:4715720-Amphidinium_carterae.1